MDYWAVDFDYESRKEIISAPHTAFSDNQVPGVVQPSDELVLFEDQWTGSHIFENEWQSFRTRSNRNLDLVSASHTYKKPGRYTIAVKVIDIFGNDTMTTCTNEYLKRAAELCTVGGEEQKLGPFTVQDLNSKPSTITYWIGPNPIFSYCYSTLIRC